MPTTIERPAPTTPDHRPSDDELHNIVYGHKQFANDGSPEEPDEIAYPNHSRGTWVTTRDERTRATQIWNEEKQVPYPDNAAENLQRTEAMLRHRLRRMGAAEVAHAAPDLVATHEARIRQLEEEATLHTPEPTAPDWISADTGQFVIPAESLPKQPAAPKPEHYTGRHRHRGMRVPLHRLIRHGLKGYTSRHAAK